VTPVSRADGETLRDSKADTAQVSMSTAAVVVGAAGCCDGGGTEE
jgi:hypothetical protein